MVLAKWNEIYLDEIVELWNKELATDFPMRKEHFAQNSFQDDNICWESSLVSLDHEEKVNGFIVAKRWQETLDVNMPKSTGWIQAMLVDSQHRNQGIGTDMLEHVETTLKSKGIEQILLGRDPGHYFPGISKDYSGTKVWFESRGYEATSNIDHDMLRSYDPNDPISMPEFPDITFKVFDEHEDQESLLAFLHRCFPGRWEYEAMKYFAKGGTGREFVIAKKNNEVVGFCRINDPESPLIAGNVSWAPLFDDALGGVGPLGIDSAERGQGYGLAIVEAGIAALRNREINNIVIDWTGLVDFYKKLGYDIWKSYHSHKKTLK